MICEECGGTGEVDCYWCDFYEVEPIVLATFEFHGRLFQVWDDEGRLLLVVNRSYSYEDPTWEVLSYPSI